MISFTAPLFNIHHEHTLSVMRIHIYIHIQSQTCAGLNLPDPPTDKNYFRPVIVSLSSLIEVFSSSETWLGDSLLIPHV